MKRKFMVGIISILTVTALLFSGCANGARRIRNNKQQTTAASTAGSTSAVKKDAKSITDSDLINSAAEDEDVQLDSMDDQSQQLSSDEIDTLLNDNSDLNNIPSGFSVK